MASGAASTTTLAHRGFADLHGYLQARCQQQRASLAQVASELATAATTTTTVARRLLHQAGLAPPPAR
jgi:hypothetical protein